jgi:hypothetical protein
MGTLVVRNAAQVALFTKELQGQLSDGYWENTRPHTHWRPWCSATVVVGEEVGRDFYAGKDNYNFSNRMLLECVGDDMIDTVKKATGNQNYSMSDLKRDLNDLKAIIKIRL